MLDRIPVPGTSQQIAVLYEDNHLLIVEKPVNLLTQGDRTGDADLLTLCKKWLKEKYNKPGNVFLGLVHRLDRPVGGLLALAKTSRAAARLSEQVRDRTFRKFYLAVVHGETPPNGVLVHWLAKDPAANLVKTAGPHEKLAKKAELTYVRQAVNPERDLSLVQIQLITGRAHQIRVQFSAEGHPLYGDAKYGRSDSRAQTPALFATKIAFRHPVRDTIVRFDSEPPAAEPWSWFRR